MVLDLLISRSWQIRSNGCGDAFDVSATPVADTIHKRKPIRKEKKMPFVNVKVIAGVFSADQKQDIIRKVTDAMVAVEGESLRTVTWVVVEEVASGDWGIGGNPLHTADVRALAAQPAR
jgi:4-oxalocrotonate tautomerase